MTLTDMSQFSQLIANQVAASQADVFDLSEKAPIFKILHPSLIKLGLDPDSYSARSTSHGIYYHGVKQDKQLTLKKGHPTQVWSFLQRDESFLLDFGPIGEVILSKQPLSSENQDAKLTAWLDYALSPELWGEDGKWMRFHQKLKELFSTKQLLIASTPGFYSLTLKARKLETFGFLGTETGNSYELFLPWDFSLTALSKLENALKMEF